MEKRYDLQNRPFAPKTVWDWSFHKFCKNPLSPHCGLLSSPTHTSHFTLVLAAVCCCSDFRFRLGRWAKNEPGAHYGRCCGKSFYESSRRRPSFRARFRDMSLPARIAPHSPHSLGLNLADIYDSIRISTCVPSLTLLAASERTAVVLRLYWPSYSHIL